KIEAENLGFAPVRPDVGEFIDKPELVQKLWDPERGTEYLIRDYLAPRVEDAYEDLTRACKNADLLITYPVAYARPIVAEIFKLPWMSVVLQPSVFLSTYDSPIVPPFWVRHLYRLGRTTRAALFTLGKNRVKSWVEPLLRLRRRLGLSTDVDPM